MCVGVESVVVSNALPSPQLIINWFAFPAEVIVKVTVSVAAPEVVSAVNPTSVTAVFLMMLNATSFRSSILLTIVDAVVNVLSAPDVVKLPSLADPNLRSPPVP